MYRNNMSIFLNVFLVNRQINFNFEEICSSMDEVSVWIYVIIIGGILLSALSGKKKQPPRRPAEREVRPYAPVPPVMPSSPKPQFKPVAANRPQPAAKPVARPFIPEAPSQEGVHSLPDVPPINGFVSEGFRQNPYVPRTPEEWRKAIVSNEILKRKF